MSCYRAQVPQVVLAVIVGLAVCQIALFCTTVFLHRAVSHKALTVTPGVRFVFRFLIWITTGIRPRQWAAVHRRHHAFTDVEGDPHSPLLLGFWRVQLTNANLYRKVARDGATVQRYARDLPADRWDTVLFDHALVGLGIGVAILCVSLGWQYGLLAAAIHTLTYLALNAAINAFGHVVGRQPYANTARNNQWLAWLTAGEGLHNNHHAAPTSARLSLAHGQLDPGWWLIRILAWRRLATIRLEQPRFLQGNAPVSTPAP
ncbi:MAG: fatty-acid desaturase [Acidimicrobiaceae bacterium]|nr:fatty-acid desaturase [Acidimicrobiaceae bacterium]